MKKSLIALAVSAVALSSAASAATVYSKDGDSLDVYGRVQGVFYGTNFSVNNEYNDNSLDTTARLGFDMRTQLTSGVAAFAKMEWDAADGRSNDAFGCRYAWLGADFGKYGVIKAGRFEDSVKSVIEATDIFEDWGGLGQIGADDKRDGIIMYSWTGNGLTLQASFQTAQDNQQLDGYFLGRKVIAETQNGYYIQQTETVDIDHGYAFSAGYTSAPVLFGPVSLKAGYSYYNTQVKETNFIVDPNSVGNNVGRNIDKLEDVNTYAFSASWGDLAQGLYLAAMYTERDFSYADASKDTLATGFEAVVAYAFDNGVSVATGFNNQQFDSGEYEVKAQAFPVFVNYQINPRFNVWAECRFDAGTDDGTTVQTSYAQTTGFDEAIAQNTYSLGARYSF